MASSVRRNTRQGGRTRRDTRSGPSYVHRGRRPRGIGGIVVLGPTDTFRGIDECRGAAKIGEEVRQEEIRRGEGGGGGGGGEVGRRVRRGGGRRRGRRRRRGSRSGSRRTEPRPSPRGVQRQLHGGSTDPGGRADVVEALPRYGRRRRRGRGDGRRASSASPGGSRRGHGVDGRDTERSHRQHGEPVGAERFLQPAHRRLCKRVRYRLRRRRRRRRRRSHPSHPSSRRSSPRIGGSPSIRTRMAPYPRLVHRPGRN
mmetsp:Transcript_49444/g.148993  ORF Transcript_49444/g.148993 Transcript_49444/m.148993 type:complete len:256 (-) Transcript_49444:1029-1796(-)